ncbi:class I SAM-dependent methyltransferase [Rarobacter incanus]|uniref:Methyltransferase family protein n=1 Tax=Rarobacter incanus TaxID=153494 RepID=A0A542SLH1_9MICO|nr:methyltransferase [Rarobacter incanus]TQK75473.1 methyltransferase family protein [Rarobacter incanus]
MSTAPREAPKSDHYFVSKDEIDPAAYEYHQVQLGGAPRRIATAPGVFSREHLDAGTSVLLPVIAQHASGRTVSALDLGCGWGPVALTIAFAAGTDSTVWAIDVNERALGLTRHNAEINAVGGSVLAALPHDVPAEVTFDLIASNPPIRIGKAALHDLIRAWLSRLAVGGDAFFVVAKKLGAESLQAWLTALTNGSGIPGDTALADVAGRPFIAEVDRAAHGRGFRVLHVHRTA